MTFAQPRRAELPPLARSPRLAVLRPARGLLSLLDRDPTGERSYSQICRDWPEVKSHLAILLAPPDQQSDEPGQALVAVQTLLHSPEAMDGFARKVAAARPGRGLAEGFRPSKVAFAILLKNGTDLTADTLFPFSQITLVQTAKLLEAWGVAVEVTGIQAATVTPSRAGSRLA